MFISDQLVQTALSQYHNLYFVAFGTQIHVFEPVFPFQEIANKPKLVLSPPMTRPNAPGYIDPTNPHTIDHLIVGDLGNDEILLLCTDSGNLAAYSTLSIKTVIDRKTTDRWGFIDDGGVKAFFSQAVDKSAWGLAIHETARLIAVSCNASHPDDDDHVNASVTVFAFSLVKPGPGNDASEAAASEDNFNDIQHQEWFPQKGTLDPRDRSRNIVIHHAFHESNIPSIAFLNNGVDPYGEWVLSTDIDGKMLLTKVFDDSFGFVEYCFGKPLEQRRIHRSEQRQMGWSVTALDENLFHEATLPEEFMGIEDWHAKQWSANLGGDDLNFNRTGVKDVINISGAELSNMVGTSSGESRYSCSEQDLLEFTTDLSEDEDQGQGMSLLSDPESDLSENEDEHSVSEGSEDHDIQRAEDTDFERLPELEEGISSFAADEVLVTIAAAESNRRPSVTYQSSDEHDGPSNGSSASGAGTSLSGSTHDVESQASIISNDQMELSEAHDTQSKAQSTNNPATETHVDVRSLPVKFPILHTTSKQIRLINAPLKPHEHFRLDNPFQHFYDHYQTQDLQRYPFDRMNMTSYIPELGVVVVASQMGQVALLVLTRDPSGNTGFRLECTLPTPQHSEHNEELIYMRGSLAYHYPLLGIATAPLQGTESRPGYSPSPSDIIWDTDREDIDSSLHVDDIRRTYEPKIVRLPSSSRMPKDGPVLQTVPAIAEDLATGSPDQIPSSGDFGERDSELNKKTSRRYRLMLYFYNHTILSYEFGWS